MIQGKIGFKALVVLLIIGTFGCAKQIQTADIDTTYYRINKRNTTDSNIDGLIAPYKVQLDAQMNEVIANSEVTLNKERPNSTLGNWFADVLLDESENVYQKEIDIALQNYGGIRVPYLNQGDITVGNIYELMPFDNKLVLLTMDGPLLQQLLDRIAEKGGWPISKTLSFKMDGDRASEIMIKGEPFDIDKSYTVAIPDYIANGGDQCFFLDKAQREDLDIMIRDMVIQHLKQKPLSEKSIVVDTTLRIQTSKM